MLHRTNHSISLVCQGGTTDLAATWGAARRNLAMIHNLITYAQTRIEKRRQFNRLANEIASLSQRDLADLRADRGEMLRHAYRKIYG
jgi:ribosomal protein S7